MKNNKGFSLVEIMVVIAILAIFIAISVPSIEEKQKAEEYKVATKINDCLSKAQVLAMSNRDTQTVEFLQSGDYVIASFSNLTKENLGKATISSGSGVAFSFKRSTGALSDDITPNNPVIRIGLYYEVRIISATGRHYVEYVG